MDNVLAIFATLGVDSSILHQFIVFTVLFVLLKIVFLDKLLFVLELREGKTTKLEHEANEKFAKSEKLAEAYNKKMNEVISQAQRDLNAKKESIKAKNQQLVREKDKQLSETLDSKRKAILQDLESQKDKIFGAKDEISKEIINKIIG